MNSRKYPRTLQEAFGPYTSRDLVEPKRPLDWQDRVILGSSAVAAIVFVVFIVVGVV